MFSAIRTSPAPVAVAPLRFMILGQSNAMGRATMIAGDTDPTPHCWLYTDTGGIEIATEPMGRYANVGVNVSTLAKYGWHDYFARNLYAITGQPVHLFVNANTSSIEQWVNDGTANFYGLTTTRFRTCAVGNTPNIDGILWLQGEGNVNDAPGSYAPKLTTLISSLRTSFGTATTPFVAGEILSSADVGTATINTDINSLVGVVSNFGVASSSGCVDGGDLLHFNHASYQTIGNRFARKWADLAGYP